MFEFIARRAKSISLIIGFLFAIIGSAWGFAIGDKLAEEAKKLFGQRAELQRHIDRINSAAHDYFVVNQQGDLIFIQTLSADGPRLELAGLIMKGNLLDRATPVRNMIGTLAIAKEMDYNKINTVYTNLNDATRATFDFVGYTQLKEFEKTIIQRGEEFIPKALNIIELVDAQLDSNMVKQKRNRILTQIASTIGAIILLCVNLIGIAKTEKHIEEKN